MINLIFGIVTLVLLIVALISMLDSLFTRPPHLDDPEYQRLQESDTGQWLEEELSKRKWYQ